MQFGKILIISALAISLTIQTQSTDVYAAVNKTAYQITYNGTAHNATDSRINFTYNGAEVASKYPGLVIGGNTAVAPAKDVFVDSGMGITYKYSSKNKKIILYHNNSRVSYVIGQNYAYVNGSKKQISEPALFVKYPGGYTRLCIPARFTAQSLGFKYSFDSKTSVSAITGTANDAISLKYAGKDLTYRENAVIVSVDGKNANSSSNPGIYRYGILMVPVNYVFQKSAVRAAYSYNTKTRAITLKYGSQKLVMTLNSQVAKINGKTTSLSETPVLVNYTASKRNNIVVPFSDVCSLLGIKNYSVNGTKGTISTNKSSVVNDKTDKKSDTKNSTTKNTGKNTSADTDKKKNNTNSSTVAPIVTPESINSVPADETKSSQIKELANGSLFTFTTAGAGTSYVTELSTLLNVNSGIPATIDATGSSTTSLQDVVHVADDSNDEASSEYNVSFNQGYSSVTGSLSNGILTLELGNTAASAGGTFNPAGGMVSEADLTYDNSTMTSKLSLKAPGATAFTLTPNADGHSFTVKLYRNTVTAVTGEYKDGQYIVNITGAAPITVNEKKSGGSVSFTIPDICDTIGSGSYSSDGTAYTGISSAEYIHGSDNSATITLNYSKLSYYTKTSGNTTSIIFSPKAKYEISPNTSIPLPDGTSEEDISDSDCELNSTKFKIIINGNHLNYYTSHSISYDNTKVKNVSLSLSSAGNTVITFKTKKVQAYRTTYSDKALALQIGNPRDLYSKIVVLDAGHGGSDTGAMSSNAVEKKVTLAIIYTKMRQYLNDSDLKIYWTRTGDTYPTLDERAAAASKVDADFFISLHMNSGTAAANGTEVWYSSTNGNTSDGGLTSYNLARVLCNNITSELGSSNRGVKNNIFVVTKKNTVPAALVELGFISNPTERNKLLSSSYQSEAAKVIYDSIEEIFDDYPTGR